MEEKKESILEAKKEIQEKIIPIEKNNNGKVTEEEFFSTLKMIAPGTNLRTALEAALKGGKGALIVVDNDELLPLIDGGFRVNCRFTPQRVAELTKMDGAIVLSKDCKRIDYANVLLTPDSKIKTGETGTRHKAAERTAKQTAGVVIAISEKKHDITLFYKNIRFPIKPTEEVRRKVNENIQLLEKQRELFDSYVDKLNNLELRNYHDIEQSILVIQKGRLIQKISEDLRRFIVELGNEGTLLKTRLKEIISGVDKETNLVIKDYTNLDVKKTRTLLESLSYDEILDAENIMKALAYETLSQKRKTPGWRILSKTLLPEQDIAKLIRAKGSLGEIIYSSAKSYFEVIGEEKANLLKEEVEKIKLNPWQLR